MARPDGGAGREPARFVRAACATCGREARTVCECHGRLYCSPACHGREGAEPPPFTLICRHCDHPLVKEMDSPAPPEYELYDCPTGRAEGHDIRIGIQWRRSVSLPRSPLEQLRRTLGGKYPRVEDPVAAMRVLARSWYDGMQKAEDMHALFNVTDMYLAADHVYVTLEMLDRDVTFGPDSAPVAEPTVLWVWTLAWGPATQRQRVVERALRERYGVTKARGRLAQFLPTLGWWAPSIWRVGHRSRISPAVGVAAVDAAVRATRKFAVRVSTLAGGE